jgi:tricarballylate dehydrogenase
MSSTTQTFDVLIVARGNAALVSALTAHGAGARVCILEAGPKAERGGNSRFASAIFRIPHAAKAQWRS